MRLDDIRKEIDCLDAELIKIISKRRGLVKKKEKRKKKIKVHIPERERKILKDIKRYAEELDLNTGFIENIMRQILKESNNIQNKIKNENRKH